MTLLAFAFSFALLLALALGSLVSFCSSAFSTSDSAGVPLAGEASASAFPFLPMAVSPFKRPRKN